MNHQPTTYAQLAAKVEKLLDNAACALQRKDLLRDDDGNETGLREAIRLNVAEPLVALIAASASPAPPAHVAELVAACKASLVFIEQELTRRYMRDMTLEALEKAIEKAPLLNQLRAAIAKHEANHPGANP